MKSPANRLIDKIRRTNTRQLLLVLGKKRADKTEEVRRLIADTLKDEEEVTIRTHQVEIEIRDIEETATKAEIAEALSKVVGVAGSISEETINSLRKSYGETQIVSLRLDAEIGRKIAGYEGKICIDWVRWEVKGK